MSAAFVSFLFAAGAATWLYSKFMKSNGNNAKSAIIAAGVSALIIFLVVFILFKTFIK